MKLIDLHCDTISSLLDLERKGTYANLKHNELDVDVEKMIDGDYLLQCFAMFTNLNDYEIPEMRTLALIDCYYRMIENNKTFLAPVLKFEDIEKNFKNNKISTMLTLEEGDVVFHDLAMLRNYYRLGVRMITLTWNYNNSISTSASKYTANKIYSKNTNNGLSSFGIQYVKEMEKLGIIVDASHLSDEGFWDLIKITEKPFIVSHSNSRKICNNVRNLSDDMLKALKTKGGIVGINLYGNFLNENENVSNISDIVKHILHIKKIAGIETIAIGTDHDGFKSKKEIKNASQMQNLTYALKNAGLTNDEIAMIFYKNALRVFKKIL